MTDAPALLDALHAALAARYPTSRAASAGRGRVACAVILQSGVYDPALCDPQPFAITAEVRVYAAGTSEQAVIDLPHHITPVAELIRSAGWTTDEWRAEAMDDTKPPYIGITASALGTG